VRNQELVFADAVSASQDENNSGSEWHDGHTPIWMCLMMLTCTLSDQNGKLSVHN
jgi:hypothetical protein